MPWRGIFGVLGLAGGGVALWVALRLPETLHPEYRRVPRSRALLEASWFVITERASLWYSLAVTTMFGSVIAYVSTVPQLFAMTFHRPDLMAVTFAFCAGGMGVAAFVNSRIVERVGMRRISHAAVLAFLLITAIHSAIALHGPENIVVGLSVSNFSAIAMQSMGAIAGSAASIQGVITMIGGSMVASVIGQQWSGTVSYLPIGAFCCGLSALACALIAERGVLFRNRYVGHSGPLAAGLDVSAS
jgi:DHA1 family bicyclomycin/chloramphenicol resistance-like MFS transporter